MSNFSFKHVLIVLALVLLNLGSASAQTAITTTTLSQAMLATGTRNAVVASATGITGPQIAIAAGGIPSPSPAGTTTVLYVDREALRVLSVSGTSITVERGYNGTKATSHLSGATVYVAPAYAYLPSDPYGSCASGTQPFAPMISPASGTFWTCPTSGPTANQWTKSGTVDTFTLTDGYVFIDPGACQMTAATTAFSTGPALVKAAAGNLVLSGATNTTAGTITVDCSLGNLQGRTTLNKGTVITDVSLLYGVQTTALSSIAAATVNSVTYPAAGGSAAGTVSTTAGGSLTVTPGTLQLATTTAGQCYNEKIAFGTLLQVSDVQTINLEQTFTTAGTTATTLQVCGVLVHYTSVPL